MDTSQWPQEIVVKPMEEMVPKNTNTRKIRPHHQQQKKDQALKNCPRCNSTNTKFCYYNNYSLSQPRCFCKSCRRYWTDGGSLRNIPVGGVSRKSKKSSNSSSSSNIMKNNIISPKVQDPPTNKGVQDLNLDFSSDFKIISELIQVPNNSFMPMLNISDPNSSIYSSLNLFSSTLDHGIIGSSSTSGGYECNDIIQDLQESTTTTTSGGILFPFEDLKQVSNTSEQNRDQPTGESSSGYWNEILGGNGDIDTTTATTTTYVPQNRILEGYVVSDRSSTQEKTVQNSPKIKILVIKENTTPSI